MSTPEPIMLRAAITADEYRELKKRAIDEGVTTAEYIARLLRKGITNDD